MAKVAPPIRVTVIRKAALRPIRSPMRPKISAPRGRKAKPAPKRASAATRPAVSVRPAKKLREMIAASVPKMKKSYHSKAVPADEATTTVRMDGPDPDSPACDAALIDSPLPLVRWGKL